MVLGWKKEHLVTDWTDSRKREEGEKDGKDALKFLKGSGMQDCFT